LEILFGLVPTEAFKCLTGTNYQFFEDTITLFWKNDQFQPIDFKQIKLSVLPKKGNLSDPNKWRGIALGNIAAKCIATRLTKYRTTFGINEQCGSLFGKGCANATFLLKLALQTLHKHNQESFTLFVFLVKAYDTVNRELLWLILKKVWHPTTNDHTSCQNSTTPTTSKNKSTKPSEHTTH
jgi:hypothetical protein